MADEINKKKSVIDDAYRTYFYEKNRPDFTAHYWLTKNYSNKLKNSVMDDKGKQLKIVLKWFEYLQDDGYFQRTIAKFSMVKSKVGHGAIPIYFVINKFGVKIPRLKVAEGVVRYSKVLNVDEYIEVIENLTTGIAPVIKITRYGKYCDTFRYELQTGYTALTSNENDYNKQADEELKRILSTTGKATHNNGVVRAILFINRVGDVHDGSESYGLSDTSGFEAKIKQLDEIDARINMIIDQDAGHLEKTTAVGGISMGMTGGGTSIDGQIGMVKTHEQTIQNVDNVDITYIPGMLTHNDLIEWKSSIMRELNILQDMQVEYDSEGKTNETNAKVDKVGDMAFKGGKRRLLEDEEFWTDLFSTLVIISLAEDKREPFLNIQFPGLKEELEKVKKIKISPRGSDVRKLFEMIQHMDKLGKIVGNKDMLQMLFDVSDVEAERMFNEKEDEVKASMVAYGTMSNGNFPQGMIPDVEWAKEVVEEETTTPTGDDDEKDNT